MALKHEAQYKYMKSSKGKMAQHKYHHSLKGKVAQSRYKNSPKGRATFYEYKNSPKGKKAIKKSQLKHSYGITLEEYEQKVESQQGTCALCGEYFTEKFPPVVDHDHKTGKFRGLLHNKCNAILGLIDDNPNILRGALKYLEKVIDKEKIK